MKCGGGRGVVVELADEGALRLEWVPPWIVGVGRCADYEGGGGDEVVLEEGVEGCGAEFAGAAC